MRTQTHTRTHTLCCLHSVTCCWALIQAEGEAVFQTDLSDKLSRFTQSRAADLWPPQLLTGRGVWLMNNHRRTLVSFRGDHYGSICLPFGFLGPINSTSMTSDLKLWSREPSAVLEGVFHDSHYFFELLSWWWHQGGEDRNDGHINLYIKKHKPSIYDL